MPIKILVENLSGPALPGGTPSSSQILNEFTSLGIWVLLEYKATLTMTLQVYSTST